MQQNEPFALHSRPGSGTAAVEEASPAKGAAAAEPSYSM